MFRNTLNINGRNYTISNSYQSTYNTISDIVGTRWTLQRGMVRLQPFGTEGAERPELGSGPGARSS